jgi:DNA-directed RNA polymerase specialized sigma24 family protein
LEIIKSKKAKEGDQAAFTFLLNHYWNEVYGFMLKRIENEASAEDITIETFSKAFDKLHHITLNSSLTPGSSVLLKCTYRSITQKKV